MPECKVGPAGDKVRKRVITGRSDVQELGQTVKDAAVVRVGKGCSEGRWQCPENILAPGAGTVEQQEPRDLEVWDRRKGLEESTMLRGESLEIRNNRSLRTDIPARCVCGSMRTQTAPDVARACARPALPLGGRQGRGRWPLWQRSCHMTPLVSTAPLLHRVGCDTAGGAVGVGCALVWAVGNCNAARFCCNPLSAPTCWRWGCARAARGPCRRALATPHARESPGTALMSWRCGPLARRCGSFGGPTSSCSWERSREKMQRFDSFSAFCARGHQQTH